jgi:hypothetical protein
MPDTVADLVTAVKSEASFDVTDAVALAWLNRRHRAMVARSRCLRYSVSLGNTVADQRDYALPDGLVMLTEVTVDGIVYGRANHADLAVEQGYLVLDGEGGVVTAEESATGGLEIALYPTPTESGDPIVVRGAWLPPDLSTSDATTLKIPQDLTDALIAGAVGTGLRRVEHRPDLAQPHDQEFAEGVETLRRRVASRYRGSGPSRIRFA